MPDEHPTEAVQLKQTPVKAVRPSGEEIGIAEVVLAQPVAVPQAATPNSLPKTGSSLPLVGLVGLLALSGAIVLRGVARRMT